MPEFSIIIPTYNRAGFVTKAINSVLSQTFGDYEIIVIDDGSTDNTQRALEPYKENIRIIYQENAGVSAARNAGIRIARGEWIAFLDSDDEWLPEYLSWQMKRTRLNPEVCMHITNSIQFGVDGSYVITFEKNTYNLKDKFKKDSCLIIRRPLDFIVRYRITNLQATIMKRESLFRVGLFNENLTIAEDLDIIARMALQGPLGICDKPLVHIYRRNEKIENLTQQLFKDGYSSYNAFFKVYDNLRSDARLAFKETVVLKQTMSSNRRALANLLLRNGMATESKKYYKEAFFLYPSIKSLLKYLISFMPANIVVWSIRKKSNVELGQVD